MVREVLSGEDRRPGAASVSSAPTTDRCKSGRTCTVRKGGYGSRRTVTGHIVPATGDPGIPGARLRVEYLARPTSERARQATAQLTVKTLLSCLVTCEFDSPADSLRTHQGLTRTL
eukprot:1185167-Prorocentrum_minimum.AAC.3